MFGYQVLHFYMPVFLIFILCFSALADDVQLNNFVTEHINLKVEAFPPGHASQMTARSISFHTDRDGWIFISMASPEAGVCVILDNKVIIDSKKLSKKSAETMRLISQGQHKILLFLRRNRCDTKIIVSSIPMLQIAELSFAIRPKECYPDGPREMPSGHTWDFYRRDILPNINVIISDVNRDHDEWKPYVKEIQAAGKKWVFKTNRGINFKLQKESDQVFEDYHYNWYKEMIEDAPYTDGIAIDELTTNKDWAPCYPILARIFDRIAKKPFFYNKKLYVYGQPKPKLRPWYRPAIESIMRNEFVFICEFHLNLKEIDQLHFALQHMDDDTYEAVQEAFIHRHAGTTFKQWEQMYPGVVHNQLALMIAMQNYHLSNDLSPSLDNQVFLDMQFHHIANHPCFKGIYGISLYQAKNTTTDMLRYISTLIRHYCIEGKRERFNTSSLRLNYLKNPGFEDGLNGWNAHPAMKNSIKSIFVKDLPFRNSTEHQIPPSEAKLLVTVRSAQAPNVVSQEIKGLLPGKLYALTVYNADLTNMSTWKMVPVMIRISNVEEIPEQRVDRDITSHLYKDGKTRSINYHFRVFRAKNMTATLSLSDWGKPDRPAGGIGHEIMWDHIKLQRYYDVDPTDPKGCNEQHDLGASN